MSNNPTNHTPCGPYTSLSAAQVCQAARAGEDLRDANLRGANLRGADLRGADLSDADLRHANLRNADLRRADLRRADLRNADLRGADLFGADLRGADMTGAELEWADLTGADMTGTTGLPQLSSDPVALRAAVADQIDAHPELHDQADWGAPDAPECDTPCCVAGWACRLGGGTHGYRVPTAATLLLHVDGLPMPSFAAGANTEAILTALRATAV